MPDKLNAGNVGGVGSSAGLGDTVVDGCKILEDIKTETSRFVLWRNGDTGNLNLAIQQGDAVVSVRTHNLYWLLAEVISKHER